MKKIAVLNYIFVVLIIVSNYSCSNHKETKYILKQAETVMEEHPDSAYALLDKLECEKERLPQSLRMRYELLRAQSMNKTDVPFTSDSVLLRVAQYYDKNGNSNERMLAYYMLGSAYRDLQDAPRAIDTYYRAVECADTLDASCDYITLFSIYGQMAMIFRQQFLFEQEKEAWEKYSHFAWKANDTYNYIRGIEFNAANYFNQGDTLQALKTEEKCQKLYLQYGMKVAAARVCYNAIYVYLMRHQYEKAHELMKIFEQEGELFDENGDIVGHREHYYYDMGLYRLGIHQIDSAEYYFRKLLPFHYDYEAYRGLLLVYQAKQNADSIVKFAELSETALDSIFAHNRIQAVVQTSALYNYNKAQRLAGKKEREAEKARHIIILIVILTLMASAFFFHRYRQYQKTKAAEIQSLTTHYWEAKEQIGKAHRELHTLKEAYTILLHQKETEVQQYELKLSEYEANKDSLQWNEQEWNKLKGRYQALSAELTTLKQQNKLLLQQKQSEIDSLTEQIHEYQKRYEKLNSFEKEHALFHSTVVTSFRDMANYKLQSQTPTETDWEQLYSLMKQSFPLLVATIGKDNQLSKQEWQTCLLTRLNFSNSEIALLLQTSAQRITNVKTKVNQKLFGETNAVNLLKNLRSIE